MHCIATRTRAYRWDSRMTFVYVLYFSWNDDVVQKERKNFPFKVHAQLLHVMAS